MPTMSWFTFAPKLPHGAKLESILQKLPKLTEMKLIGITDYGYCEVSGDRVTHFRFFVSPVNIPTAAPQTAAVAESSFAYTLTGTDSWMPDHTQLADVTRTTTSFERGWEYRVEHTNDITSEHWWVPADKVEAFELFIKDNSR